MIRHGIPMAEYLSINALSSSVAHCAITQSPAHARYMQISDFRKPAPIADIGTVAHRILLEGSEDGITVIDADDWRTKAAKEARDGAYAAGKVPILARKMDDARALAAAAKDFVAQSEIAGCFESGASEVTVEWQEGDMPCKARPDWLNDTLHLSLKTTDGSAEPSAVIRNLLSNMGYGFNLAFYRRGLLANGIDVHSAILTVEQNPPYGCSLVSLDPAFWDLEDTRVERAIRLWQQCTAADKYPMYPTRICYAEPKAWQLAEAEETSISDWELGGQP